MVWGKRSHLVFQTDRNSGEVIRWLGNFSIWPFQTLALSGKDWSDQETFDLNSTSHYRLPGNIFAVLFKYGFRFPAQVSWSLAKGCILSYRPTSWTIPWPPITNPVTYAVIMHPKADPITNAILDTMTVFCLLLKPLSNLFWTKIVYIISDIRQSNDQTGSAMFNNRLWCRWYLLLILPLPNQIMMIDQNKVHPTIRRW